MRIQCPECKAGYRIPDEKIPVKGANIRCKKCQARFFIKKEGPETAPVEAPEGVGSETGQETLPKEPPPPPPPAIADEEPIQEPQTDIDEEERQVDQYVEQGDEEAAADLLVQLITKSLDGGNFVKAESLLEKMYDVTPMALNEIVKAGELIEEKKSESIDPEHMKLWARLYHEMKDNEASELYYSMKKLIVPEGEQVYSQGEANSNLYFVADGKLQIVFQSQKDSSENDIKTLRPGQVANIDPFFSYALCPASLVAEKDSKLTYLEKSLLDQWKEKLPAIENKIRSFCYAQGTVGELIKKAGFDINIFERVRTELPAMIQLLDDWGKPGERPFKITMSDISAGGFGYMSKIHRSSDAETIFGRNLIMQTILSINNEKKKISVKGQVVAVHIQAFGESSVHIRFHDPLNEKIIELIGQMESGE